MKKCRKSILVLLIIVFFTAFSGCGGVVKLSELRPEPTGFPHDQIVVCIHVAGLSEESGHTVLYTTESLLPDAARTPINMDGREELAQALERYRSWFGLIDYDETLSNYSIWDLFTGENLGQLDAEGLYNAFDLERFEVKKSEYSGQTIKLSELEENATYKYSCDVSYGPQILNDTGSCVIIYYEDNTDQVYKQTILARSLDGSEEFVSAFFDRHYESGNLRKEMSIRYECIDYDELLKYYIEEDYIVRLSRIKPWHKFLYDSEECYLMNDTADTMLVESSDGKKERLAAGEIISFGNTILGTEFTVQKSI